MCCRPMMLASFTYQGCLTCLGVGQSTFSFFLLFFVMCFPQSFYDTNTKVNFRQKWLKQLSSEGSFSSSYVYLTLSPLVSCLNASSVIKLLLQCVFCTPPPPPPHRHSQPCVIDMCDVSRYRTVCGVIIVNECCLSSTMHYGSSSLEHSPKMMRIAFDIS